MQSKISKKVLSLILIFLLGGIPLLSIGMFNQFQETENRYSTPQAVQELFEEFGECSARPILYFIYTSSRESILMQQVVFGSNVTVCNINMEDKVTKERMVKIYESGLFNGIPYFIYANEQYYENSGLLTKEQFSSWLESIGAV